MSHQNPPDAARVSRIFFYILMFAILGWFTYMQFFGADERRLNVNSDSMIYTGTFTWEKSDGHLKKLLSQGDMICLWVRQWYLPHVFRKTITRIPWPFVPPFRMSNSISMAHCALLTTPARHDWPAKTLPAVIFSVRLRRPMPAKNSASS